MKDLLESLRDVDFRVRKEAVLELKKLNNNEGITLLIEALGDETRSQRDRCRMRRCHGVG